MAKKDNNSEAAAEQNSKRTKIGTVVSNKMQKTVVVAVENTVLHPMYLKYVKRTSKFLAHSEQSDVNIGDRVVIEETRPLSKRKRWNVREVLQKTS
ncbi:MAG TPA: 30S ribosomal protein S17 [Thermoanaerobaculia bacterium]|jgi:small subunit ribosomal protein S17